MKILTTIEQLHDQGIFSDLDIYFAKFMLALSQSTNEELLLGSVLVSHLTAQGHTCANLLTLAEQPFPHSSELGINTFHCPRLATWLDSLQNCSVVGSPGDYTPLILEQHRLYLYRYWDYEQQLATQIRVRTYKQPIQIDYDILATGLAYLFSSDKQTQTDEQKPAALTALLQHFSIISGGPGTGKTTIIIKLLVLLLEQNPNLNIALTAPTGKAAIRLQEAIIQALPHLNCATHIKMAIPQETYTIHRLLSKQRLLPRYHSHTHHLLPYDVIIIDEAAMVDLALMAQLTQVIPLSARWILIGDKDQLASVGAGTVLSDICEAGWLSQSHFLQKNITLLEKNYRFGESSGIGALAQAVKQGQAERALHILKATNYPDVNWSSLGVSRNLPTTLIEQMVIALQHCLEENQPETVLKCLEQIRILGVTRRGPYGVAAVNRKIAEELTKRGIIRTDSRWYHGCPIMITRNDYTLKLFNGDVGIILKDPTHPQKLQAFFPASEPGQLRCFWPNRLPEHETVYAMTIHKSQGSEFDQVLILFPDQFSKLFSRELVYTAITRARHQVHIWGNERVFKEIISRNLNRASGLYTKLIETSDSR